MLSLGTGQRTDRRPFDEVKDWGLVEWARPILDVVFDGISDAVDYQLRHALPEDRDRRLQTELEGRERRPLRRERGQPDRTAAVWARS